jgi:hypothetical protein
MKRRFSQLKIICLICISVLASNVYSQSITPWTEQNGTLGLGYPVPIPVDTPEPFDGFRTYAGLFAKHQMMALENDYITGHIVGQTIYNRDIWAYLLSDGDDTTRYGVKEGAMMANGGIHAREWQSPETLTQIITDFHDHSDDESFYQYLLENAAIITIPSNNIDGFLQTQRYPTQNWYSASIGPRDGRMRRKNLLNTDEDLNTQNDFLNGVDLNRNNNPYWASGSGSSNDPSSLVYHGPASQSEPETMARLNAADLVDADQLRIYTDVHSFSQVHFANKTFNNNLNILQTRVLADFSNHHKAFPAGKNYIDRSNFTTAGFGIGSTDEYFQLTYQIPSWTLEIEPSGALNPDAHPNLPGVSADYGGFANNGNDGFILPESEIKRVREQLAESFMVTWYGQAGPPSITQLRIIDQQTNAIVFDAEWDITEAGNRELYSHAFDQILASHDYALLLRFDKPMRYRNAAGEVDKLQGQSTALTPVIQGLVGEDAVELNLTNPRWVNNKDNGWESYGYYQDDTFVVDFNIDAAVSAADDAELTWKIITTDMVGQSIDANPATVITWSGGQWINYEDSNGNPSINGGFDETISINISSQAATGRRMQKPITALYFDPSRNGEGFNLETLNDERILLQWYTFDENGNDQWMLGTNPLIAENAVRIPEMLVTSGGVFGPEFNPDDINRSAQGSVEIVFESASRIIGTAGPNFWVQTGKMKYTSPGGQKLRTDVVPITFPSGMVSATDASETLPVDELNAASVVGSWFNPERNGEGFHIQQTLVGNAVILWYSYDLEGKQKWFIGSNGLVEETDDNIKFTFDQVFEVGQGTRFGSQFNADEIELSEWGSIEVNLQCTTGSFKYDAIDSDYGSDEYGIEPITRPIVNKFVCPR